jgi:hypothetical protein
MALLSHMPFWGGGAPPILTHIATTVDTSNADTFTFTGASIGTAAASRLVVVVVHAGDTASISSVTIDGNAADLVIQEAQTGSPPVVGIYQRAIATGTTADIVVTLADPAVHCFIDVYTITGLRSTTAIDSDKTNTTGAGASSVTLTTEVNAVVIAAVEYYTADVTSSWSGGVTENSDEAYSAESGAGSGASGVATGTSISPSVTPSGSADRAFVAAAWR